MENERKLVTSKDNKIYGNSPVSSIPSSTYNIYNNWHSKALDFLMKEEGCSFILMAFCWSLNKLK